MWFLSVFWSFLAALQVGALAAAPDSCAFPPGSEDSTAVPVIQPVICNCNISQGGVSYPISALQGTVPAASFYSYGVPNGACANTGLELGNALVLFLYENINTGLVSIFLIADIANDGSGGSMQFELSCLPASAYVVVQDDPGEFGGTPPVIAGNWNWGACCTDGGVVENIGCNNSFNVDLLAASGVDSIVWLTGDIANPTQLLMSTGGEVITINCGGPVCCPIGFDTEIAVTDAGCPGSEDGAIDLEPEDGTPPYIFDWSNGENTEDISGLAPGVYMVTITDANDCTEALTITVDFVTEAPPAEPASLETCSSTGEGTFDLTEIISVINNGSGDDVLFFEFADLTGPINDPEAYVSVTATIYAVTDNGFCYSEPVPVDLIVNPVPIGNPTEMTLCEEANEMSVFDLTSLDGEISGGNGIVLWYEDNLLTNPINEPDAFVSGSTIVYAVVDDGQCLSAPVEVELTVLLQPVGDPTSASACGNENNEAVFDLTTLEAEISGGNGVVDWYLEIELQDPIFNVTSFQTVTTTVFAVIFDGQCDSDPIPVELLVSPTPVAMPWLISACDDGSGMAWFDLWAYADSISGGMGSVEWFLDETLVEPVPNPGAFLTESTIIFATVDDGVCVSDPVPVSLHVVPDPSGNPANVAACVDSTGQGIFDLTAVEAVVSGGMGTVGWFSDPQATVSIAQPGAFVSAVDTTVYAIVTLGLCLSMPVPVDLMIINEVIALPAAWQACDNGNDTAVFNLHMIDPLISQGTGQVSWYVDAAGTIPVTMPGAFVSPDTILYARVTAGACFSDIVPVTLDAVPIPVAIDLAPHLCGDTIGQALVDLTQWDIDIAAGTGMVVWYSDSAFVNPVLRPDSVHTGDAVFYVVVNGILCSQTAAVVLDILESPSANPAGVEVCVSPGQVLPVDLTAVNTTIAGGTGTVYWYEEEAGQLPIAMPSAFPVSATDTVFAIVSDGTCLSLAVSVPVTVIAQPSAMDASLLGCADMSALAEFDLTQVETYVAGGSGVVTWFLDSTVTQPIPDPSMVMAGNTTIYALVTNGICMAGPVPVQLMVTDSLVANPVDYRICVTAASTAILDLSALEAGVSGGTGQVIWFYDSLATDTIMSADHFTTDGDTLYAVIAQGECTSAPVMVTLEVVRADPPLPACIYSSIDSVAFSWLSVAPSYDLSFTLNGQPIGLPLNSADTIWGYGGLGQGDTLSLTVSALADTVCAGPIINTVTCITEICPAVNLTLDGLDPVYCRDEAFIVLDPQPQGGQLSGVGVVGDTLWPGAVSGDSTTVQYTWLDVATGCNYAAAFPVIFVDPPAVPDVTCSSAALYSVSFEWGGTAGPFGYFFSVNGGSPSLTTISSDTELAVPVFQQGDAVALSVWSIGAAPCANSDTITLACASRVCQPVSFNFTDPGVLCAQASPVTLRVQIPELLNPSITWAGPGIINSSGVFDPALAQPGTNTITIQVEENGCMYFADVIVFVQPQPVAAFEIQGVPCAGNMLDVIFTGIASSQAVFEWTLHGGDTLPAASPALFSIVWPEAGSYAVDLVVTENGCSSGVTSVPVLLDAPLAAPEPQCETEDYYSVTVSWPPVPGAAGYQVATSAGRVSVSGTTCTVRQLEDDSPVTITVTATGPTACGPSAASVDCRTIPYIPPLVYVPTVFSPNQDGINDIFYVQTNAEISIVSAIRIYDRWGDVVFEAFDVAPNDPAAGWNGTFRGKPMNPEVFVYWIEALTVKQKTITVTGDVTIVR